MNEPNRTQWQIRCAFNGFCKQALKREAMNAHRDTKRQQSREVTFSDLSPQEENQLYTYDKYFADDEAEQSFIIAGKEITAKLLSEALRSLPEEKRETILLYYFFDMSETEISRLRNIPRTTVKYRRNSSFELLKRYLEERALLPYPKKFPAEFHNGFIEAGDGNLQILNSLTKLLDLFVLLFNCFTHKFNRQFRMLVHSVCVLLLICLY